MNQVIQWFQERNSRLRQCKEALPIYIFMRVILITRRALIVTYYANTCLRFDGQIEYLNCARQVEWLRAKPIN